MYSVTKYCCFVGLLLISVQSLVVKADTTHTHNTNIILVVGDSISAAYGLNMQEGWVSLLQMQLDSDGYQHYQVINASISGNTTGDGVGRLPKLLKVHQPEIVIIELGGNDGLRGYPIKIMTRNLQKMVDLSVAVKANVLLVGIEIPPNYGSYYTGLFRQGFQTIANTNNIAFLPFILEGVAIDPTLMQNDGIHPVAAAQPKMLSNVWDYLEPLLYQ
ncbi:MAG: acyl-CoA thioesterase-1 [Candidatus Endobugula sp.]|jgi:acyl-CoA thioesterase-1